MPEKPWALLKKQNVKQSLLFISTTKGNAMKNAMTAKTLKEIIDEGLLFEKELEETGNKRESVLRNIDFTGIISPAFVCHLKKSHIACVSFIGGDFTDLELSHSIFKFCTFEGCNFSETVLNSADFKNCKFYSCNFTRTNLSHSSFKDCMFDSCYFESISVNRINLLDVTFDTDCYFIGLNLSSSVNFEGVTMEFSCSRSPEKITAFPITIRGLMYRVLIAEKTIKIGCQEHTLSQWERYSDKAIRLMDGEDAIEFWSVYKPMIIGTAKTYLLALGLFAEDVESKPAIDDPEDTEIVPAQENETPDMATPGGSRY